MKGNLSRLFEVLIRRLKEGDVKPIIEGSETYGLGMGHDTTWWRRVLRQCVALGLLDIAYKVSLLNN